MSTVLGRLTALQPPQQTESNSQNSLTELMGQQQGLDAGEGCPGQVQQSEPTRAAAAALKKLRLT